VRLVHHLPSSAQSAMRCLTMGWRTSTCLLRLQRCGHWFKAVKRPR